MRLIFYNGNEDGGEGESKGRGREVDGYAVLCCVVHVGKCRGIAYDMV